ncbi:hypothetical protein AB0G74_10580 [Streptomyces sp. NPDC020875]|uniref:hypothetical protein n=1 Tax=Streptomyces sp. NPDC020875 TaxID=3154898 RepID=UPI0033FC3241
MRALSVTIRSLLPVILATGALTAGTTAPASAGPAQTCYGGSVPYTSAHSPDSGFQEWPANEATTGPNCADINIRPTQGVEVRVCLIATGTCNGWTWAPANSWTVIASGVPDNTHYFLRFKAPSNGRVAD